MGQIVVTAVYAISVLAAITTLGWIGPAIGALMIAVGIGRLIEVAKFGIHPRLATYSLAVVAGIILIGADTARLGPVVGDVILLTYQGVLAAIAVTIVADVVWWTSSSGGLARFVLDLGTAADGGTLRDRLARAVGDPSITLGYTVDGDPDSWADDLGRPLVRPRRSAHRAVTPIAAGGRELGFVAHDPALVGDAPVFALIAAAAGLAISNAATQLEIRRQVKTVDQSRERLVHAADAQGRRIESALEQGVDARLGRVDDLLTLAAGTRPEEAQLSAVRAELAAARRSLRDFSRGVYPAALKSGGVRGAIDDLARRSPIPVERSRLVATRFDPVVESTLYFVCSEALANVAKHARASRVSIELGEDPFGTFVHVDDDGIGGARISAGSGLRGLLDRVEALGGSLVVSDRPGGGTSLRAAIPRARTMDRVGAPVG
jgi:signal transduction histidine kinase